MCGRGVRFGLERKARHLFRLLLHRQGGAQERNHISGIYRQIQLLELIFITEVGHATVIIDGDISKLTSALNTARSQATNAVAGIEQGFRGQVGNELAGTLGVAPLLNPVMLTTAAVVGFGAALAGSVQAAAAWQSSMSGVSKTTGLTGQDLNTLSKELLDMSTRMPAAASEIANVAQVAGSLGIAAQDIAGFTEVAIQMGVGFEMSADQAATSGAKILTAFKLDTTAENMEKLGSVVNAMGDSFAATEPQVLGFLNRASFLNTTMGQTIPQIAALGTVLISTGLEADVAATGLKSFLNMATSVRSKTGGMDNWAALMNISVEELKANLAGDFNQTLIDTANAIAAIEDPVERFQTAVALAGTEGAPAILKLAGQQENLQKALGLTNDEWERAQSLQKTYAAQSETFNAQMQIFWNVVNMAGTELGTVFLPALTSGIGILADMTLGLIATGEAIYGVIEAWNELGKYAEMEKKYEEEHGGRWELIGGDAVWIGETVADAAAKEIEENERLQNAGAEAIQAGIDAGVFKKAGEEAGEETGDAFAAAVKAHVESGISKDLAEVMVGFGGISDLEALAIINKQTATTEANPMDLSPWADRPTPYLSGYDRDYIGGSSQAFLKSVRVPYIGSVNSITEMKDALMEYGATAQQTGAIIEELFAEDSKYAKYMRVEWGGEWEAMKASNDRLREGAEDKAKYMQEYLDAPEVEWENNRMSEWISGLPIELQAVEDFDTCLQKSLYNISQGLDIGGTTKREGGLAKRLAELTAIGDDTSRDISQNITKAMDAVYAGLSDEDLDFEEYNLLNKYLDFLTAQGADQASIDALRERFADQLSAVTNLWDAPDTTRSWTKFMGENEELAKQAGDLIIYELYNAQNAAIEAGDATLQESFGNVMKGLADPGSVPANVFNQSLADIIDAGYVSDGHRAAMQEIAENDAEEFRKNLVGGMAIELPSLAEIIENPKLINESFEDMAKFQEGYLIPRISQNMDDIKELLGDGVSEEALYEAYIKPLKGIEGELPTILQDLIGDLEEGTIDMDQFLKTYYEDVAGKADEKSASALEDIKSANAMFYGEFLSDNAQWQSYVNENGGYVGPTKLYGGYRDAMDAEIAAAQEVNQKYGISTVGSIGMVAEIDTTEALSATEELVARIQESEPNMVLNLDTNAAYTAWGHLVQDMENLTIRIPVELDIKVYTPEIRAMIAEELRAGVV